MKYIETENKNYSLNQLLYYEDISNILTEEEIKLLKEQAYELLMKTKRNNYDYRDFYIMIPFNDEEGFGAYYNFRFYNQEIGSDNYNDYLDKYIELQTKNKKKNHILKLIFINDFEIIKNFNSKEELKDFIKNKLKNDDEGDKR